MRNDKLETERKINRVGGSLSVKRIWNRRTINWLVKLNIKCFLKERVSVFLVFYLNIRTFAEL